MPCLASAALKEKIFLHSVIPLLFPKPPLLYVISLLYVYVSERAVKKMLKCDKSYITYKLKHSILHKQIWG